ncbi:MAG: four helix bundle protein [Bacteroidota bacterium]|nr:four helix bundle protein [Bacteroidota bacterium]MDP4229310.1 four helix bundle protein [Bacteroidota bacterium]MDP4234865.1 four helix bundle protein [Bacteroidota bacterium]
MGYPDRKIDIHERTFDFAVRIVEFCRTLDNIPTNWVLSKQLAKSGTSIGANVEEAQGGQSKPDFIAKISIALKESRETNYWLRVIKESKGSESDELLYLIQESSELMKILAAILIKARS